MFIRVRPRISTVASSAAKKCSPENDLSAARDAEPTQDERSNLRSFTDEEKLAIVLESEQPGVSVAEVCRRRRDVYQRRRERQPARRGSPNWARPPVF